MSAVGGILQAGAAHPSVHDPAVLPGRYVLSAMDAARKEITPRMRLEGSQPILDGFSRLFGQFELDGPAGQSNEFWLARISHATWAISADFQAQGA